jgi:iron complex outermembrane receptor protein
MIGSDGVVLANLIPGDANNVDATTSQKFSKSNVSGKIGLDYSFDDNLLYLSYSRGYRASSFAAQAFFTPDELTVARPETVDSIEGGFKLDLLDRRLRLNGALFHYSYRDQQFIDVNPDSTQRLLNLPRSRILGGEIELTARPIQALTVNAGLGWLDSQIKEGIVQGVSVSGNQLPNAPRVSLSYGADWTIKESDWGKLSLNVNGSLVGAQYFDTQNNPELRQRSYNTIGARLGVRSANDQFGIALWGKNLTDEYYFTSRVAVTSFGFNYNHVGAPRTYGVTIDAKF